MSYRQTSWLLPLVLLVTASLAPTSEAHAQLLSRASDVVRGGDSSSADDDDDDDSSSSSSDAYDDDDDDYAYAAGVPVDSSADTPDVRDMPGLPPTPYPYGDWVADGYEPNGVAVMDVEGAYVFGGGVRVGGGMRIAGPHHLDVAARFSVYGEPRDDGYDSVGLGRIGIDWRVVDHARVQLRIGGGARMFADAFGPVFGIDASLGLDVLPFEPLVLMIEAQTGFVGLAWTAQLRGAVALMLDGWAIYAGYEHVALGSGAGLVDLAGPMVGLAFWP